MVEVLAAITPAQWFALGAAAFLTGTSKCGVPGSGMLAIPAMAWAFPARQSTAMLLLILIIGDVCAVALYRRHGDWRVLWRLFPAAAAGVIIGALAMAHVSDRQLRVMIGAILLILLLVQTILQWRQITMTATHAFLAISFGVLAGFTTMTANAAGPLMMLYLLLLRFSKERFVGTSAYYFFVVNLFKVPFSVGLGLMTSTGMLQALLCIPLVISGALTGRLLLTHMPQKLFTQVVSLFAAAGAIALMLR